MKYYDWDTEKNIRLEEERGISFEEILACMQDGGLLDIIDNPNKDKYPHQKTFVVLVRGYVYAVPFVEDESKYFLKTIIPSRELTKIYLVEGRKL